MGGCVAAVSDAGMLRACFAGAGPKRFSAARKHGVAHRVRDLHEPAREVQQEDEQTDARREQRHEFVAGEEGGQADDPQRAEDRVR